MSSLAADLLARLPELEWKLSQCCPVMSIQSLPPGLFSKPDELHPLTPKRCVDEIKADLHQLTTTKSQRAAQFLGNKILQKINVLVHVTQLKTNQSKPARQRPFGLRALSTRQQWLNDQKERLAHLMAQEQALSRAWEAMTVQKRALDIGHPLHQQWCDVKRQVSLAQEEWVRATGGS